MTILAQVEGNGVKCPNCGSMVPAGGKVCGICNAYQPRLRKKAYVVVILMSAFLVFELAPLALGLASGEIPFREILLLTTAIAAIFMIAFIQGDLLARRFPNPRSRNIRALTALAGLFCGMIGAGLLVQDYASQAGWGLLVAFITCQVGIHMPPTLSQKPGQA